MTALTLVRPVAVKRRCPECGETTVAPAGEPCGFCQGTTWTAPEGGDAA